MARRAESIIVSLGEVCSIEARLVDPTDPLHVDRVHVGGANIVSGHGELTELNSAKDDDQKSPKFFFSAGDVLYSKIRPYLRKVGWPQISGLCSADIYPLRPTTTRILPTFLKYLLLSNHFTAYAVRISNRAGMPKVNREQLFAYQFVLPSLPEQSTHVARLDGVFQRLGELGRLADVRQRELWALKRSLVFGSSPDDRDVAIVGELVEWVQRPETVAADVTYSFAGVKSFGGGVFPGTQRRGDEFSYKTVHRLRAGEFVYPKLMAWEGAFGMVPEDCSGLVVSPEFVVFRPMSTDILPEVLDTYFRSPSAWPSVQAASTGTNRRRRRLHPKAFLTLRVPHPSHDTQIRLRKVYVMEQQLRRESSLVTESLDVIRAGALSQVFAGNGGRELA